MEDRVSAEIDESISVKQSLRDLAPEISLAAETLLECYRNQRKALFFGNGGSAADAQHLAAELAGRYALERPPLAALALSTNASAITAIANDYGFEQIFARQLRGFGRAGDVAVGISTSGNSVNVVAALAAARELGMKTITLTGQGGGQVQSLSNHCIRVPSRNTPRVQEAHILIGHIWCGLIEHGLFAAAST